MKWKISSTKVHSYRGTEKQKKIWDTEKIEKWKV